MSDDQDIVVRTAIENVPGQTLFAFAPAEPPQPEQPAEQQLAVPPQPEQPAKPTSPASSQTPLANGKPLGFDEAQLRRLLRFVLDAEAGATELRVMGAQYATASEIRPNPKYSTVLAGWYDSVDALVADAAKLRNVSAYICYNPASRELLARCHNTLKKQRATTVDDDIVCLRWMFVDVDAARKVDISSTDAERGHALALQSRVLLDHIDLARASVWGSSGNGAYILVRLPDYPNDADHRQLVADALASLASRYGDEHAHIDPRTRNPARIGPLPGTLKCKGSHMPDRPWRLATIEGAAARPLPADPADDPALIPVDLREWLARNPPPDPKAPAARAAIPRSPTPVTPWGAPGTGRPPAAERWPRDVKIRRAVAWTARADPAVAGQGGHDKTFDVACSLVKGFDLPFEDAWPILLDYNTRCVPPWSEYDLQHKLHDAVAKADDKPRGFLLDAGDGHGGDDAAGGGGGEGYSFSDMGNAGRFLAKHGHVVRYCEARGGWLAYDGRRWRGGATLAVERMAQDIPGLVIAEMPASPDPQVTDPYRAWALRSEAKDRLWAAVAVARSHVSIEASALDRDPWLLNVENGTIDLRTGVLRPHDPADLITRVAPVIYDPEATCPLWDRVLHDVFAGRRDLVEYWWRVMARCLTGTDTDQHIYILHGDGANGKSLIMETHMAIIGDYAEIVDPRLLLAGSDERHPTGLAKLAGSRLAWADEVDDGCMLAEATVKRMTGQRRLTARRMGRDFFDFDRQFKIFLSVNHKPEVRGRDHAIWRRIVLVPFEATFGSGPGRIPITDGLEARLEAERPGILGRLLVALRDYQAGGMRPPGCVLAATQEMRDESDIVGQWMTEWTMADPEARTYMEDLYLSYSSWMCIHHPGTRAISRDGLGRDLSRRGLASGRDHGGRFRRGIRIGSPAPARAPETEIAAGEYYIP